MRKNKLDSRSLIIADIGNMQTQVTLFDNVNGGYRYLATGKAMTTAFEPLYNFQDGLLESFYQLETISGQTLLNQEGQLLMPVADDMGVDDFGASFSAGEAIKVVLVGLLENVSILSAKRVIRKVPAHLIETMDLASMDRVENLVDKIVSEKPELVFITGGTDNGAVKSLLRLVNIVRMAIYLLPEHLRPRVLFAGNAKVAPRVNQMLSPFTKVYITENVRPALKKENLEDATNTFYSIYKEIQMEKIQGLNTLDRLSSGTLMPISMGYRNMFQFFSKSSKKNILGVNLSSRGVLVGYSTKNAYDMTVFSDFGSGTGLQNAMTQLSYEDIAKWIPADLSKNYVLDFIQNRILYPKSVPTKMDGMHIENAITTALVHRSLKRSHVKLDEPFRSVRNAKGISPFDKIYLSGYALVRTLERFENLIMMLNALQPSGLTELVIDKNNLLSSLGVAAQINPLLAVQVFENSLISFAHVIAPMGKTNPKLPVLQMKITSEEGQSKVYEFKADMLYRVPLRIGRNVKLELQPLQKTDIGWGPGRGGEYPELIQGSMVGFVIDTRNRPYEPTGNKQIQQQLHQNWLSSLQRKVK